MAPLCCCVTVENVIHDHGELYALCCCFVLIIANQDLAGRSNKVTPIETNVKHHNLNFLRKSVSLPQEAKA